MVQSSCDNFYHCQNVFRGNTNKTIRKYGDETPGLGGAVLTFDTCPPGTFQEGDAVNSPTEEYIIEGDFSGCPRSCPAGSTTANAYAERKAEVMFAHFGAEGTINSESELEDAEWIISIPTNGSFHINVNPENDCSPSCLQFHLSTEGVTHIEKALPAYSGNVIVSWAKTHAWI